MTYLGFVQLLRYFLGIAGELLLLFVLISFIVALLQEYIPPKTVQKIMGGKHPFLGNFIGAGLGALTPFCSCSTIPLFLGMLRGGVPFGATVSFLIASPLLNPVIIGLMLTLFGPKVTLVYGSLTFLFSVASGELWKLLGLEGQIRDAVFFQESHRTCCQPAKTGEGGHAVRISRAFRSSFGLFRQVIPYLLLGAGIGAFIHGFVPVDLITTVAGPEKTLAVPAAAVIGIPMYIRAATMLPIGLTLVEKGMGLGTVAALLIGGAGASLPELTLLGSIFHPRGLAAFVLTVFTIATTTGFVLNTISLV